MSARPPSSLDPYNISTSLFEWRAPFIANTFLVILSNVFSCSFAHLTCSILDQHWQLRTTNFNSILISTLVSAFFFTLPNFLFISFSFIKSASIIPIYTFFHRFLPLSFLCVFFIKVCQGSLFGFLLYSWADLYANVGLLTRIINWLTARENNKTILSSPSAES